MRTDDGEESTIAWYVFYFKYLPFDWQRDLHFICGISDMRAEQSTYANGSRLSYLDWAWFHRMNIHYFFCGFLSSKGSAGRHDRKKMTPHKLLKPIALRMKCINCTLFFVREMDVRTLALRAVANVQMKKMPEQNHTEKFMKNEVKTTFR